MEKDTMLKSQERLKNKYLILIRELKRDFSLEGNSTTFNEICDLFEFIKDLCVKDNRSDLELKDKKPTIKKQASKTKIKIINKETKETKENSSQNKDNHMTIKIEFPTEYKSAKEFEEINIKLKDRTNMLELELQDKDLEVEESKTRLDVICLDLKQEKEVHQTTILELRNEIKNHLSKFNESRKQLSELQSTLIAPSDYKSKIDELGVKQDEISRLRGEIKRINDSMQTLKNEKIDLMRKMNA
mmetsp:Transcript_49272/g.41601  ORF Transcript_49272/g.41601 Transcript_49272/m.41601 type:complete len:244 (+) Transcript_49272:19-750(+)